MSREAEAVQATMQVASANPAAVCDCTYSCELLLIVHLIC